MSLKAFHIFFIALSILLAVGFAGWMVGEYSHNGNAMLLVGGCASLLTGVALCVYGIRFLRKLKHVQFL